MTEGGSGLELRGVRPADAAPSAFRSVRIHLIQQSKSEFDTRTRYEETRKHDPLLPFSRALLASLYVSFSLSFYRENYYSTDRDIVAPNFIVFS